MSSPAKSRSPYFQRLATRIGMGKTAECRFCERTIDLDQLDKQYEMCDTHWTHFCLIRWPDEWQIRAREAIERTTAKGAS